MNFDVDVSHQNLEIHKTHVILTNATAFLLPYAKPDYYQRIAWSSSGISVFTFRCMVIVPLHL